MLDTQALLWFRLDRRRLGRQTLAAIEAAWAAQEVVVSTITFWEVAMLSAKSRIDLQEEVGLWRQYLLDDGLREIEVDGIIAVAAGSLDYPRGDPADRLIIATAMLGWHQLVTTDRDILAWSGPLRRRRAAD